MLRVIEGGHGRKHDLPPFWDGLAVVWEPWEPMPLLHMCGKGKKMDACKGCDSTDPRRMAAGLLAVSPDVAHDVIRARPRLGRKPVAFYLLAAFRCPECLHDVVHDLRDDQVWDLEPIDYCDSGSVDPAVDGVLF